MIFHFILKLARAEQMHESNALYKQVGIKLTRQ
jgi:hypothetical protein